MSIKIQCQKHSFLTTEAKFIKVVATEKTHPEDVVNEKTAE